MTTSSNGEAAERALSRPSFLSPDQLDVLRKSALCSELTSNQQDYFFEVVARTRLDPFTGQLKPILKTEREGEPKSLVVVTTLQGLRTLADRSGFHDGEEGPEWCGTDGIWKDVWLSDEHPAAARSRVYRSDRTRPYNAIVLWSALAQFQWDQKGNQVPSEFWSKMGPHMLGKCSLAAAHRAAYPDQCSGLYIPEELSERLDPNSEEAIEAEMVMRARREKEYWDKEREKGNLPINEIQAREKEIQQKMHEQGRQMVEIEKARQAEEAEPAWAKFQITRIKMFAGRTVKSLSRSDVIGLRPWIEKAAANWGKIADDVDLQNHYTALVERTNFDISQQEQEEQEQDNQDQDVLERLPDGLDFSQV